jgi:hypothetical protein
LVSSCTKISTLIRLYQKIWKVCKVYIVEYMVEYVVYIFKYIVEYVVFYAPHILCSITILWCQQLWQNIVAQ